MKITNQERQRLESKIEMIPFHDCWEWVGAKTYGGYGQLMFRRKSRRVTRLIYEITYGEFPQNLYVLHRCDNPGCVRPDHLFLGSQKENMVDMIGKKRSHTHTHNHPHAKLDPEKVKSIRAEYIRVSYKKSNVNELAEKYQVHPNSIRTIVSGKNYGWV